MTEWKEPRASKIEDEKLLSYDNKGGRTRKKEDALGPIARMLEPAMPVTGKLTIM